MGSTNALLAPISSYPDSSLPKGRVNDLRDDLIPYPANLEGTGNHRNLTADGYRMGTSSTVSSPMRGPSPTHDDGGLSTALSGTDFGTIEKDKQRAGENLFPIARRTFSSPESLTSINLGTAVSPTSPQKAPNAHPSNLKRSQSQLASAGSKINSSTIFMDRPQRASSVTRLDYSSEGPSKIDDLHERVVMLAAVMDSERQSLLKRLNDTGNSLNTQL